MKSKNLFLIERVNVIFKPIMFKDSINYLHNINKINLSNYEDNNSPLESVALTVGYKLIQINTVMKSENITISFFTTNLFPYNEQIQKIFSCLFNKCINLQILYITLFENPNIDYISKISKNIEPFPNIKFDILQKDKYSLLAFTRSIISNQLPHTEAIIYLNVFLINLEYTNIM